MRTITTRTRSTLLGCAAGVAMAISGAARDIESGQWFAEDVSTNAFSDIYAFQADTNDTVIIRVANEDSRRWEIPDLVLTYEDRSTLPYSHPVVTGWTGLYGSQDLVLPATNFGWYFATCSLPTSLYTYSNTLAYSVSILRMPGAPLCREDLDVGPVRNGDHLAGTINVGADLDAAAFAVSNPCTVQVRMGQQDVALVPTVQIFDPFGTAVSNDYPAEYRAELTATLTNRGIYTVVLNDYFEGRGRYHVSLVRMGQAPVGPDTDLGPLISGEWKIGTVHVPGDLDIATFSGLAGDRVDVYMREATPDDVALNPVVELFDPDGTRLARGSDLFQESATLTNVLLSSNGVYSIVCKDAQDRSGVRYALFMEFLPGSPSLLLNKPGAPANLAASDGSYADQIFVSWSPSVSTNVTGYDLWRSADAVAFTQLTTNRPATTYQDYDVPSNTVFYYRVAARNATAVSDFSNTNSGYRGSVLPAPPPAVAASDGTFSNFVLVTWTASATTNVTGYDVWRNADAVAFTQLTTNRPATTYQDYGAAPNPVFSYRLQARNAYGLSAFSPEDTGYRGTTNVLAARRALLVGIDRYGYGPGDLATCTNDADGVRRQLLLGDPSNRWSAARIALLTDSRATKEAIRAALYGMARASGAGDVALYYQSSHGGQSPGDNPSNTYLCTYNADYSDAELGADLALFRPDTTVVIILDACFSAGMYRLEAGGRPPAWQFAERVMAQYRRALARRYAAAGLDLPANLGANIAFMTSSDYHEVSWTSDYYSLYTRFLLKGSTLALVNTNLDRDYSFHELHAYAAAQTLLTRATQHAQSLNPALLSSTAARAVDPGGVSALHFVNADFDGDGASDLAAFQPATGYWRIASLKRWQVLAWDNFIWGGPGFIPVDGDYDGDRASDLAVYNPRSGEWRIASLKRRTVLAPSVRFGGPDKTPVCGDYTGDGVFDGALYQQPDGFWHVITSAGVPLLSGVSYTGRGYLPVSGDFDGDGVFDLAMYHPATGYWFIGSLVRGPIVWGRYWGGPNLRPVPGDYDADGYSDLALYQPATGAWMVYSSRRGTAIVNGLALGGPTCLPVPGDYDGDGRFDLAVYEPATGYWHFRTADGNQSFSLFTPVGGPGWLTLE